MQTLRKSDESDEKVLSGEAVQRDLCEEDGFAESCFTEQSTADGRIAVQCGSWIVESNEFNGWSSLLRSCDFRVAERHQYGRRLQGKPKRQSWTVTTSSMLNWTADVLTECCTGCGIACRRAPERQE